MMWIAVTGTWVGSGKWWEFICTLLCF